MPVVYVDIEAAELIEAAVTMLEAALNARVKRADPEGIISNSLALQAGKLATFRRMLHSPEPPPFGGMTNTLREKALTAARQLVAAEGREAQDNAWRQIQGITIAADIRRAGA